MCRVCGCYSWGTVVRDIIWRRLLCRYDLRKGDLFVLSWERVRRLRRGSISSELLMCGRDVRSIFVLPLVARCLETIGVCIWRMFVFMSVVVTVWDGDYASQLPYVWHYVGVKSIFNMLVKNASPRRSMCFRCLMFSLSGPCELLFLLCFIASWN